MALQFSVAGKTDVGLVRSANEDNLKLDRENGLFIVCDGMGGHQAGEVASKEACDIIGHCFSHLADEISGDEALGLPARFPPGGDLLVKAIRIANRSIYIRSRSRSDLSGMGTTVVGAVLENNLIEIAHVGDSRAYRLDDEKLVPLTTDHSWVSELQQSGQYTEEEAAQVVNRNIITRALGVRERVETDFRANPLKPGEIYIMCTDGLCGYVSDEDIFSVAAAGRGDVNKIVDGLIKLANERGGQDNVTVVALRIDKLDQGTKGNEPIRPVTISEENDEALLRESRILESIIRLESDTEKIVARAHRRKRSGAVRMVFVFLLLAVIAVFVYFFLLK